MYVLLNDTLYLRISDSRVIIILVNHNVYEYYLHCKYYIILVRRRIRRSYYEPYLIKCSRSRYPTYLHSKHAEYVILNFVSHKIGPQTKRRFPQDVYKLLTDLHHRGQIYTLKSLKRHICTKPVQSQRTKWCEY
uniref:Uncharacterized protein n=1 Tax=Cacopsylla melanoneura TaxID=428564 RepID=A0A8D8PTE1_9HEMI